MLQHNVGTVHRLSHQKVKGGCLDREKKGLHVVSDLLFDGDGEGASEGCVIHRACRVGSSEIRWRRKLAAAKVNVCLTGCGYQM